ncbi:hypothetical protein MAR_005640, partial [Mya arenaria]
MTHPSLEQAKTMTHSSLEQAKIGRTHAYHRLHKVPPPVRLTNLAPVLSLIFQMAIIIAVQVFFFIIIKREP